MFGLDKAAASEGEESDKQTPFSSTLDSAVSEARAKLSGTSQRKAKSTKASPQDGTGVSISSADKERLAKCFTPEAWEPVVELPYAIAAVMTGIEEMRLTAVQKKTLATPAALVAEHKMSIDPATAAMFMLGLAVVSVSAEKISLYYTVKRKEREAEKQVSNNGSHVGA